MNNASLVTMSIVAGLMLSLNPVSISIFVALLSGAIGKGHTKTQLHATASSYLLATTALYAISGSLILAGFSLLSSSAMQSVGLVIALSAAVWGLVNVRNFFWYERKRDMPEHIAKALHAHTVKKIDPASAALLALTAAYASLPSSLLALLSYATIFALLRPGYLNWTLLFALLLVIPLVVIFVLALRGLKLSAIIKWKEDSKAIFRLCIGLTLIFLSWFIFLVVNGSLVGAS